MALRTRLASFLLFGLMLPAVACAVSLETSARVRIVPGMDVIPFTDAFPPGERIAPADTLPLLRVTTPPEYAVRVSLTAPGGTTTDAVLVRDADGYLVRVPDDAGSCRISFTYE